jgi:3-methyladenine DNA glycosylase AlkD
MTPAARKRSNARAVDERAPAARAQDAVLALRRLASKKHLAGMPRFAIPTERAFGVPMGAIQGLAKRLGPDHALAEALWATGWYEARLLASFVGEPERVTSAQMDRWCRDFDNWAVCDTVCFHLFDRSPHAFAKVRVWAGRRDEFQRRAAFALLACLAFHDRGADEASFTRCLPIIEEAAADERNFVKKGVSWALRGIGHRNADLHASAVALARRLAESPRPAARWVGKDALRDLTRPLVLRKVRARGRAPRS